MSPRRPAFNASPSTQDSDVHMRPPPAPDAPVASLATADGQQKDKDNEEVLAKYHKLKRRYQELEEKHKEASTELQRSGERNVKMREERNALLDRIIQLEQQAGIQTNGNATSLSPTSATLPTPSSGAFPRTLLNTRAHTSFIANLQQASMEEGDEDVDPLLTSRHVGPEARRLADERQREGDPRHSPSRSRAEEARQLPSPISASGHTGIDHHREGSRSPVAYTSTHPSGTPRQTFDRDQPSASKRPRLDSPTSPQRSPVNSVHGHSQTPGPASPLRERHHAASPSHEGQNGEIQSTEQPRGPHEQAQQQQPGSRFGKPGGHYRHTRSRSPGQPSPSVGGRGPMDVDEGSAPAPAPGPGQASTNGASMSVLSPLMVDITPTQASRPRRGRKSKSKVQEEAEGAPQATGTRRSSRRAAEKANQRLEVRDTTPSDSPERQPTPPSVATGSGSAPQAMPTSSAVTAMPQIDPSLMDSLSRHGPSRPSAGGAGPSAQAGPSSSNPRSVSNSTASTSRTVSGSTSGASSSTSSSNPYSALFFGMPHMGMPGMPPAAASPMSPAFPYSPFYYPPFGMVPGALPPPPAANVPPLAQQQQQRPPVDAARGAKPKRLKAHTVTTKSFSIPMVPRDKRGKPMLPLNVGIMTVINLGEVCMREHFHTERYIFPVGYEVSRRYLSTLDPNVEVVYHCTILDGGDGPKFQIVPADTPDRPIIAGTATGAWSSIVKQANAIRRRQHSNSVSGPDFFGLGQNTIKHLIQELPNADRLRDYVWQNFVEGGPLGGRHAAVIPALPEEYESTTQIGPFYPSERERLKQERERAASMGIPPAQVNEPQERKSHYPPHLTQQTPSPNQQQQMRLVAIHHQNQLIDPALQQALNIQEYRPPGSDKLPPLQQPQPQPPVDQGPGVQGHPPSQSASPPGEAGQASQLAESGSPGATSAGPASPSVPAAFATIMNAYSAPGPPQQQLPQPNGLR